MTMTLIFNLQLHVLIFHLSWTETVLRSSASAQSALQDKFLVSELNLQLHNITAVSTRLTNTKQSYRQPVSPVCINECPLTLYMRSSCFIPTSSLGTIRSSRQRLLITPPL